MNEEKQIEELARSFCGFSNTLKCSECSYECYQKEYARKAFEAGYRRIYDDHQRPSACYALGCQMADSIEKKVAGEFIEAVDQMMELVVAMTGCSFTYFGKYAELKKKYAEDAE